MCSGSAGHHAQAHPSSHSPPSLSPGEIGHTGMGLCWVSSTMVYTAPRCHGTAGVACDAAMLTHTEPGELPAQPGCHNTLPPVWPQMEGPNQISPLEQVSWLLPLPGSSQRGLAAQSPVPALTAVPSTQARTHPPAVPSRERTSWGGKAGMSCLILWDSYTGTQTGAHPPADAFVSPARGG